MVVECRAPLSLPPAWRSLATPMSYTRGGSILRSAVAAKRGRGAGDLYFSRSLQQQQQQQQHRSATQVPIAPHRQCSRFLATGTDVPPSPPPPPKPDSRRQQRHQGNPVPRKEDLPVMLTAAGMVQLCGRPENRGSPLVGLDVAPSNFGVAITDETRTFSIPLTTVQRRDSTKKLDPSVVLGKLQEIVQDSAACGLVVGWPLSKSGRAEGQCLMVLQFLRQLHLKGKITIPVTLRDERLTSVEAREILKEEGLGRKIAAREDETAAMIILQGFLDSTEAEWGGLSTLPAGPSRGR